jgi:hypothetical protein
MMTTERESDEGINQEEQSIWIRGLYMLLFLAIYGVAEVVVAAVTLLQFGWVVATDERNARLERFGASLSEFIRDVIRYWTFCSENKPFPFSEWPQPETRSEER